MRRSTLHRRRSPLAAPLVRWGFTLTTVAAVAYHLPGPALAAGALAWLAWRAHSTPRKVRR